MGQRLGNFSRLQVVTTAVLDIHHLDLGVLGLDLVHKTVAATGTGGAGLVVPDNCHFTFATDFFSHLVSRQSRCSLAVSLRSRHHNVAVHTRVKSNDRNLGSLGLFQQGNGGLAIQCSKADSLGIFGQCSGEHVDLLVHLLLGFWALESDLDFVVFGSLVSTLLHGLPELVLEAFGDQGNIDFLCGSEAGKASQCEAGGQCQQLTFCIHGLSPDG